MLDHLSDLTGRTLTAARLTAGRAYDAARVLARRLLAGLADWAGDRVAEIDRKPPWFNPRHVSLDQESAELHPVPVSRHDLAESGLRCPLCDHLVAAAGDFSQVRRCIVDGRESEVIRCTGTKSYAGEKGEVACKGLLVAHPDTEHGDHLAGRERREINGVLVDVGEPNPEWHVFRRVDPEQIAKERLGDDITTKEQTP